MLKTLSYVHATEEEIKVGGKYYFGQLWDGNGDGEELLESGSISTDNENVIDFKVIEKNTEDILESLVEVTSL